MNTWIRNDKFEQQILLENIENVSTKFLKEDVAKEDAILKTLSRDNNTILKDTESLTDWSYNKVLLI